MDRYFACFGLPGSLVLTIGMSLYALVLAMIAQTPARWLCFLAMALSSVGDIFLMRLRCVQRVFPNSFVIGACAFMVSHIVYTASFGLRIRESGKAFLNPGAYIALAIAAAGILYLMLHCKNESRYVLALVYGAIIAVNCMTVCSYAWSSAKAYPLAALSAVGVISFLLSDMIIGLGMLTYSPRYDHLIWWLYPIGQILLITGAGMRSI